MLKQIIVPATWKRNRKPTRTQKPRTARGSRPARPRYSSSSLTQEVPEEFALNLANRFRSRFRIMDRRSTGELFVGMNPYLVDILEIRRLGEVYWRGTVLLDAGGARRLLRLAQWPRVDRMSGAQCLFEVQRLLLEYQRCRAADDDGEN
jgi:hypothetical protein